MHNEKCQNKESGFLYKIGMFAAMNKVSVKTLRFYEEQGLLLPSYIDEETNYRYYRLNQMAILHQIQALKQAGFTLEEIMMINSGVDEESIMLRKKAECLEKIAELTKKVAVLDGYLAKKKSSLLSPVLIKEVEQCKVAYVRTRIDAYSNLFDKMPMMGELMEKAGCVCALPEYCFTNYIEAGYKEEDIEVELCEAITQCKDDMEQLHFKVMPKVKVASIFHKGAYNSLSSSYEIVLKYVEDNGYKIIGPIRECYIDGIWNKEDESEWLTEIQIPID